MITYAEKRMGQCASEDLLHLHAYNTHSPNVFGRSTQSSLDMLVIGNQSRDDVVPRRWCIPWLTTFPSAVWIPETPRVPVARSLAECASVLLQWLQLAAFPACVAPIYSHGSREFQSTVERKWMDLLLQLQPLVSESSIGCPPPLGRSSIQSKADAHQPIKC